MYPAILILPVYTVAGTDRNRVYGRGDAAIFTACRDFTALTRRVSEPSHGRGAADSREFLRTPNINNIIHHHPKHYFEGIRSSVTGPSVNALILKPNTSDQNVRLTVSSAHGRAQSDRYSIIKSNNRNPYRGMAALWFCISRTPKRLQRIFWRT